MGSDRRFKAMLANAERIRGLRAAIDAAFKLRESGPEQFAAWKTACAAFHAHYDSLAFPGGYGTARDRIRSGDASAIEAALCFLECRPYFFRSGYMFQALLRSLKQSELSFRQSERLQEVVRSRDEHRERRPQPKRNRPEPT